VRQIEGFSLFRIPLPCEAKSSSKIRVTLIYPLMKKGKQIKGYSKFVTYDFKYAKEGEEAAVTLDFSHAKKFFKAEKVLKNKTVTFKIQFVPVRPIK
jgi:hypothetical protein